MGMALREVCPGGHEESLLGWWEAITTMVSSVERGHGGGGWIGGGSWDRVLPQGGWLWRYKPLGGEAGPT